MYLGTLIAGEECHVHGASLDTSGVLVHDGVHLCVADIHVLVLQPTASIAISEDQSCRNSGMKKLITLSSLSATIPLSWNSRCKRSGVSATLVSRQEFYKEDAVKKFQNHYCYLYNFLQVRNIKSAI